MQDPPIYKPQLVISITFVPIVQLANSRYNRKQTIDQKDLERLYIWGVGWFFGWLYALTRDVKITSQGSRYGPTIKVRPGPGWSVDSRQYTVHQSQ